MADNPNLSSPLPDVFSPATRDWFLRAFKQPTAVQSQTWHVAARGEHALVIAPTGSGKTLAAFLYALDQLSAKAAKIPARRINVKPHASSIFHR
ncbi:DEAD/DEAH box helicase [Escherichia coli]|nr:DEAD/DEAH box helicase [Escherichia coli]